MAEGYLRHFACDKVEMPVSSEVENILVNHLIRSIIIYKFLTNPF
jgi:hypothetical protein